MKITTLILIVIILVLVGVITINAQVISDSTLITKIRDASQEKINDIFKRDRSVTDFKESIEIDELCPPGQRCREGQKLSIPDNELIYEGKFEDSGEKILTVDLE